MAGEDPRYLDWIRRQSCCNCDADGGVEAHHMTGAGMGMRANDHEAMPLCTTCHRAFHDPWSHRKRKGSAGKFWIMTKEQRRTWQRRKVLETLFRYVTRPAEPEPAEDTF